MRDWVDSEPEGDAGFGCVDVVGEVGGDGGQGFLGLSHGGTGFLAMTRK